MIFVYKFSEKKILLWGIIFYRYLAKIRWLEVLICSYLWVLFFLEYFHNFGLKKIIARNCSLVLSDAFLNFSVHSWKPLSFRMSTLTLKKLIVDFCSWFYGRRRCSPCFEQSSCIWGGFSSFFPWKYFSLLNIFIFFIILQHK